MKNCQLFYPFSIPQCLESDNYWISNKACDLLALNNISLFLYTDGPGPPGIPDIGETSKATAPIKAKPSVW